MGREAGAWEMRKTLDPEVLIFHSRPGGKVNKR
jgi:hypothetical protein